MEPHVACLQILMALRTFLQTLSQLLVSLHAVQTSIHKQRLRARRQLILQRLRRRRPPVVWTLPRSNHWWDAVVPGFTSTQFIQNFRVSRESFEYICRSVCHVLQRRNTNYRMCIPVRKRVAIGLWKLATNSEYRNVSELFGVGISTVFNCVQDFCNSVIKVLLPVHIKFPDAEKLQEMATFYSNQWKLPQCVGAIHRSHIPIIAPQECTRDYMNSKGWNSIVLQVVVDGKGLFWDVCVGQPGSMSDDKVLVQSYLWERLHDGELMSENKMNISGHDVGYYLIGDSAYPLQSWLLKPFTDTDGLTPEQQRYNLRMSNARAVMEKAFERLNGRWRGLLTRNDCKLDLTKKMVLTCCVLHNICEEHGDTFSEDFTGAQENLQPTVQMLAEEDQPEGVDVRAALMDYFSKQDEEEEVLSPSISS